MRISLLSPGDLTKILRFTKLSKQEVNKLIENAGKLIAKKGHKIVIIPNKGIPLEIAKSYKENKGKKVYGIVPTKDKDFGIKHIQQYLSFIDEKIEVDTWYEAASKIASSGELCIVLGLSPGVIRALAVLKFHRKYRENETKAILFKNTISSPLQPEIEEEIPITYINTTKELEKII